MTNRLPGKACVMTNSRVRRTAIMGAAATALIAATPTLHAATSEVQSARLQQAVRNALRLPVGERMSVEAVRKAFGTPTSLAAASRKIDLQQRQSDHGRPRPDRDPAVERGREHLDRQYRRPDRRHRHRRLHRCGRPRHGPGQRQRQLLLRLGPRRTVRRRRQSCVRQLWLSGLRRDGPDQCQPKLRDPAARPGRFHDHDRQPRLDRLRGPACDPGGQPGGPVDPNHEHRRYLLDRRRRTACRHLRADGGLRVQQYLRQDRGSASEPTTRSAR